MPSISVFRRKWKDASGKERIAKEYSAQIRFGEAAGGAKYLRSTGEADRRKAEAAARRIAAEIEAKELPKRGRDVLTMETMFARWIVERGEELRSGKDIKWQIKTLLRFIGGSREIAEIGNSDVNGFVQDAKLNGVGAVAINRCLERLRATMNYAAVAWEAPAKVINWKAFMQEENGHREVYLSPEEARRLMEVLPERIALAFAFTLYTGARLNELATLDWSRVDMARGVAVVITKAKGKKVVTRPLWLSEKALRILEAVGQKPEGKVFDVAQTNLKWHWKRGRQKINRMDVTWHDLRGMTATWARQHARADIRLISKALGHSDTKVTERYARVVDREIVEMLDKLPDISTAAAQRSATQRITAQHNALIDERKDHENL